MDAKKNGKRDSFAAQTSDKDDGQEVRGHRRRMEILITMMIMKMAKMTMKEENKELYTSGLQKLAMLHVINFSNYLQVKNTHVKVFEL